MNTPSDLPAVAALAGDGEPLWGLGGLWIIKVSAAQTGGSFSLIEVRMRRGTGTPLHRHDQDEETFVVLAGTLALLADDTRVDAGPGEIVYLPGGRVHAWRAESAEARFLVLATPRHEAFYRECCVPAASFEQPRTRARSTLVSSCPRGRNTASRSSRRRPLTSRAEPLRMIDCR
jgi:quercetin dioxygenase-like cupin family protein